jgi:transposase-like protein
LAPPYLQRDGCGPGGPQARVADESGATENAASVKRLLTHLRDQCLPTDRKYLFIIDGAKALRAGIKEVFGAEQPVQRCRNHKLRNVLDELPDDQQGRTLNLMRAAWKVTTPEEGEKRLEQLSRFLEHDRESPAPSLREVGDPNWRVLGDPQGLPRPESPTVIPIGISGPFGRDILL